MITIYASGMSRSRRALWVCEEAGAPYEVVELTWPPSSHPDYLRLNPAGTVPALTDGELVLIESLAIGEYVARKHAPQLLSAPGEPDYWAYQQWSLFGEATLQPTLAWARRFGPLAPQAMADARDSFALRIGALEQVLADGRSWLMGDRFTLADISVGFPVILAPGLGMRDLIGPAVTSYRERLRARPACQRAYAR